MAQNYPTIDASVPGGDSGASLANKLNQIRATLLSTNSGSVEPEYKAAGTLWIDNAASPWTLKMYDGADWIPLFQIDPSANLPVYAAAGIGSSIHGATAKTTLADTDTFAGINSTGNVLTRWTWENIKTALNSLYAAASHSHTVAQLSDASANGRSLIAMAYADMRTALGLGVGSDVQAYDPQLSSLIRQNSKSAAYTLVLSDGGKHIYHPAADTTARIWTIPANSSVAFPIGTVVTFDNDIGAGSITIAITSDTLVLVGAGTTGSRTLAAGGQATAIKVTSTRWRISGVGLT